MVAASKIFEFPINRLHCSQIPVHEGQTCCQAFIDNYYRSTLSGLRYYAPLLLVPILMKRQKMAKSELMTSLRGYLHTVCASSSVSALVFGLVCLFRNFQGKFTVLSFMTACYLGLQICWLFSKQTLRIFTMATSQVALESVLRQWKSPFAYRILNSKGLQTVWFMLSSAILMHFKRKQQYKGFWFIQPEPEVNNQQQAKCKDGQVATQVNVKANVMTTVKQKFHSLQKFLCADAKTYLAYGLSLDILSAILKIKLPTGFHNLPHFLVQFSKRFHFKMTSFFLAYICLYRLVIYYFRNLQNQTEISSFQHFLASLAGGFSYVFVNKLTLNTFAFILAIQVLWQTFCHKSHEKDAGNWKHILEFLKKIPISNIIFPISCTYIILSYILCNQSVNGLGKTLLGAVTDQMTQRIFNFVDKNTKEFILNYASLKPALGLF